MDPPSNFTFVDAGIPNTRKGGARGSTTRSVIRSHAMQQVWEQRRLRRGRDQAQAELEIVLERDGSNKAEPSNLVGRPATSSLSLLATSPGNHQPRRESTELTRGGAMKNPTRRKSRPTPDDPTKTPPKRHQGTLRSVQSPLGRPGQIKRVNSDSGWAQEFWATRAAPASPGAIAISAKDPFDRCVFKLSRADEKYLHHYFQALSWRFTMPKQTWMRYAMQDPGLLHGVLSIAAAHYSFATTRSLSADAQIHHTHAVGHVQKCLAVPELRFSDPVIGCIGRMLICHLVFGDRQYFLTHIQAIQRSTQARGGLEKLGMEGQLHSMIASCVAGAAICYWDSVPDELRHPYGPLDYPAVRDTPYQLADAGWGTGFRTLHHVGFLSDKLLEVCEAMALLNSPFRDGQAPPETQQRLFAEACNRMSLRLIYMKVYDSPSLGEPGGEQQMRECVRLAVFFYLIIFQRDLPALSIPAINMLHQLQAALAKTDLENVWGGGVFGESLLWIMVITGSGCVRPQERDVVGAQMRHVALKLGVASWAGVKAICARFLYLDTAAERKAWPLWKTFGILAPEEHSPVLTLTQGELKPVQMQQGKSPASAI